MIKDFQPATIKFDAQGTNWRAYGLFVECLQRGHVATATKIREKYGQVFPSAMESLTMFGFAVHWEPAKPSPEKATL